LGCLLGVEQGLEVAQPLRLNLRQDRLEDAALEHDADGRRRTGHAEELQELVGDAVARQRHQAVCTDRARVQRLLVGYAEAEARVEAAEAEDPQMVFCNPLQWVADE